MMIDIQYALVTPAKNEAEYIEKTLSSVVNQTIRPVKWVVVSDGSTDKTDEIVRQYQSQNVTLIRQEPRAGKTSALNMAVAEAKGEILVFSDANSIYAQRRS